MPAGQPAATVPGQSMSPRNIAWLLSKMKRGPVRLAVMPRSTGPSVPTVETPHVYLGAPDSRLPAVNAQATVAARTLAGIDRSMLSQVTLGPIAASDAIWTFSLIFDFIHDPK